jgi:hypothetical protein
MKRNTMNKLKYNELKVGVKKLKKDYIVYKKVSGAIVQLILPKGTIICKARNFNVFCKKLRADQAYVGVIIPITKTHVFKSEYATISKKLVYFNSLYDRSFRYRVGDLVKPRWGLSTNIYNSCDSGIHFFCTLKEAEAY